MTEALESHLLRQIDRSARFFWHRLRWRAVSSYLPREPFRLVDVGAGAGLVGLYLAEDRPAATYQFVEPIPSLNERLRKRYGRRGDAAGATHFGDARFVVLLDVLEHQPDDRRFMTDLVDKMEPGSTLILTVPARERLWSAWDEALGHVRRYEKDTLLDTLDGLPLAIREISYLFPEMVPLALWRKRSRSAEPVPGADDAEFPNLPDAVNSTLYGLGCLSLALRKWWGTGTSLFVVATVRDGSPHTTQ